MVRRNGASQHMESPMSYRIDNVGKNAREILAVYPDGFESVVAIIESDDCDNEAVALVAAFNSCPF